MTLGDVYRHGKKKLISCGNESPAFETSILFTKAFGLNRQQRIIHSGETASAEKTETFLSIINERAAGRPLQYILGEWPFMGLNLKVGEGVLIPREETELLVKTVARFLGSKPYARVADLCSGSGAVALGIASLFPNTEIYAVECFSNAFSYLKENISSLGFTNVVPAELDIFKPDSAAYLGHADCITANPPYVKTGDIAGLQSEVQKEPKSALDGGMDGLDFYHAIADIWMPIIKPGGMLAVEIGEGQADSVIKIFRSSGGNNIKTHKDFNGIERVISCIKLA